MNQIEKLKKQVNYSIDMEGGLQNVNYILPSQEQMFEKINEIIEQLNKKGSKS